MQDYLFVSEQFVRKDQGYGWFSAMGSLRSFQGIGRDGSPLQSHLSGGACIQCFPERRSGDETFKPITMGNSLVLGFCPVAFDRNCRSAVEQVAKRSADRKIG